MDGEFWRACHWKGGRARICRWTFRYVDLGRYTRSRGAHCSTTLAIPTQPQDSSSISPFPTVPLLSPFPHNPLHAWVCLPLGWQRVDSGCCTTRLSLHCLERQSPPSHPPRLVRRGRRKRLRHRRLYRIVRPGRGAPRRPTPLWNRLRRLGRLRALEAIMRSLQRQSSLCLWGGEPLL